MPLLCLSRKLLCCTILLLVVCLSSFSQTNKVTLVDGRQLPSGVACERLLESWPREVLFGISITAQGEVFFTMTGGPWFDQLFTGPRDGVAVDLVLKDQFDCKPGESSMELPLGQFQFPVYLANLKKNILEQSPQAIVIKLGTLPPALKNRVKDLEGNLVIIKEGTIGHYTSFTDIDRSVWDLLPMGLYTDTLISTQQLEDTREKMSHICDRKVTFTVPFPKGKSTLGNLAFQHLADSLQLKTYYIKDAEAQIYNSVEGVEEVNEELKDQRITAIQKAIQQQLGTQVPLIPMGLTNWPEFMRDIEHTRFASWKLLSEEALHKKLEDPAQTAQLEPMLSKHRKAVITFYLDRKDRPDTARGNLLSRQFKQALTQKNFYKAALLQDEMLQRVADSRLPSTYMDSLEVPQEKPFINLLADRQTLEYKYGMQSDYDAVEQFKVLLQLDTTSMRIRYNLCALSLQLWQYDTTFVQPAIFWKDIQSLYKLKIDSSLVRRMQVNYQIVSSEHSLYRADYAAKDISVNYILANYAPRKLGDLDLLPLAKYLCYYSQRREAVAMVERAIQQRAVSEDVLFYYVNMRLFESHYAFPGTFMAQCRKAVALNKPRFCRLFNSINDGGASFQLLRNKQLNDLYCEKCR